MKLCLHKLALPLSLLLLPACSADDAGPGGEGGSSNPGSGGDSSASGGNASGGSGNGSGGTDGSSGGSGSTGDCTPNPSGSFVAQGDVVFDERTCLTWMKEAAADQPYAEAGTYCSNLELGGKSDWRLPTAGEGASLLTNCAGWPPVDTNFFPNAKDIWSTTGAGQEGKICGVGEGSKLFYVYGPMGPKAIRCVSGAESVVPDRSDCGSQTNICAQ